MAPERVGCVEAQAEAAAGWAAAATNQRVERAEAAEGWWAE